MTKKDIIFLILFLRLSKFEFCVTSVRPLLLGCSSIEFVIFWMASRLTTERYWVKGLSLPCYTQESRSYLWDWNWSDDGATTRVFSLMEKKNSGWWTISIRNTCPKVHLLILDNTYYRLSGLVLKFYVVRSFLKVSQISLLRTLKINRIEVVFSTFHSILALLKFHHE